MAYDAFRKGVDRLWVGNALALLEQEGSERDETPLLQTAFPDIDNVVLWFKDEAAQPTGSLKHRLARALFAAALCDGRIGPDTTIVECSSGSTAISEAYFARLLGLRFIAVVPRQTAASKVAAIEAHGGSCRFAASSALHETALEITAKVNGYFMDQFANAERVTDWRSAASLPATYLAQLSDRGVCPDWIVVGAGTGGTATAFGRHIRRSVATEKTRLCVVDPEASVFFDSFRTGDRTLTSPRSSLIEGIGRPRVEPSFHAEVVDRMIRVGDAPAIAATRWISTQLGRLCGASTGAAVQAARLLAQELACSGGGHLALIVGDDGERYAQTYFCDAWAVEQGLDPEALRRPFEPARLAA